jgi:hypothetical protein
MNIQLLSFCYVFVGQRWRFRLKNGRTRQDIDILPIMRNGVFGHAAAAKVVVRLFPGRKSDQTYPRHDPQCTETLVHPSLRLSSVLHLIKHIVICALKLVPCSLSLRSHAFSEPFASLDRAQRCPSGFNTREPHMRYISPASTQHRHLVILPCSMGINAFLSPTFPELAKTHPSPQDPNLPFSNRTVIMTNGTPSSSKYLHLG